MADDSRTREQLMAELEAIHAERRAPGASGRPAPLDEPGGERLRRALEQLRAVMVEVGPDGHNRFVSPSITSLLGYSVEEVTAQLGWSFVHDEDMSRLIEMTLRLRESGEPITDVLRARHKSGHWVWLEITSSLFRTPDGETCTINLARDVTAMKQAGDALRASEDRFKALTGRTSDLILEVDERGVLCFLSENCREILGHDPQQLLGTPIASSEHIHGDDLPELLEGLERIVGNDRFTGGRELRLRHADGSWRWFDSHFTTYGSRDGKWRALVVARDVTARRRAKEALRASEERYRIMAETTHELLCELDAEGRLHFVSPGVRAVLGFEPEELTGTTPFVLLHPDDVQRCVDAFLQGLATGEAIHAEPYRVRGRDGSWRWLESDGLAFLRADGTLRFLSVSRDRTDDLRTERERRNLEERMQQTQRLEGLGVMAGGIAHDFNNLLTPILGDAGLALMDLSEDSPARPRIERIQKAARRAAALTNQMLAYAGKDPLLEEPIDVSGLVREMTQLLETSLARHAALDLELGEALPAVRGDTAQLTQVVMNLLTNAAEAVGESAGRIGIRTGSQPADEPARGQRVGGELPPGRAVVIEVEDDGCGMDAETVSRIFDPFFTTKFTGRGLGLAAALGIVRAHGGAIEIETARGAGTRFRLLFPAAGELPADVATPPGVERWSSNATVLVIDDDEAVRDLTRETLARAGLRVLCAADAAEGLALHREHADALALVILDRTMPSASVAETVDALRARDPATAILLISGYSEDRASGGLGGLAGFLQKPFLPEELLAAVRRSIDG